MQTLPPSPRPKRISLTVVNGLPPNTTVWDADLKGFCARRQRSQTVSYLLKMRVGGRVRWFTIGRHGQPHTPETARKRARQILGDPMVAAKAGNDASKLLRDVLEEFFAIHGPKLKPGTLYIYRSLSRTYLVPAFGKKSLTAINRADVAGAHAKWKDNPRSANHALSVLSKLMSWAEDQGYRPEDSNPCRRIERYAENKREKFLTIDELGRLGAALDQAAAGSLVSTSAIAAIRLLILTGARLGEILTLSWQHVDFERRMLFLPDSKTGQKPLHLNDGAIDVLASLPRLANNPFVIFGHRHGGHLVNLQKPWRIVHALAGLNSVRIHDLRHTFASYGLASGGSLPVIGRQLGHSQPQTTQRYAHLADDPVRKLTQDTGRVLAHALQSRQKTTQILQPPS